MTNNNNGGSQQVDPSKNLTWVLGGFDNLQLDIVGFLAILGEGSVLANAQVSSLSRLFCLPRVLPAPQAFLRPSRHSKLQAAKGYVTGVHSGNDRDYINHVGNVVLDAEDMGDYSIRCVEIVRNPNAPVDVKVRTFGPLSGVAIFGLFESFALLAVSSYYKDGMAVLATILLSFLSVIVGVGNKWRLQLNVRANRRGWTPAGDVVIRYPRGSFLVVKCTEDVARSLYFAPENIDYYIKDQWSYRLISLVGTIMLMFAIICLSNSKLVPQIAFAVAYMIINALYWIVAALPPRLHWDTSAFIIKKHRFDTTPEDDSDKQFTEKNKTFTQALWKVIVATKSIEWARRNNTAPNSPAWAQWLLDAQANAQCAESFVDENGTVVYKVPDWDPQHALITLLAELSTENSPKVVA